MLCSGPFVLFRCSSSVQGFGAGVPGASGLAAGVRLGFKVEGLCSECRAEGTLGWLWD